MAWVIRLQGGYLTLPSRVYVNDGESLTLRAVGESGNSGGAYRLIGDVSGYSNLIEFQSSNILIRINGASFNIGFTKPPVDVWFELEIARSGNTYTVSVDDSILGTFNSSNALNFNSIGAFNRTNLFYGMFEYIQITAKHNYDATASNHTTGQPVLTDTIGGNNAQGVNFPTDGSAWVDLGGDPVLEVDVPSIVNSSDVFTPESVQVGTPDVQIPLIQSTVSVQNPEILSGSIVQVGTVEGSSNVPNPEVLYGKVLQAESVQGESVVYGVSIAQPLNVGLEKVNSDSVVFDLYVLSGDGIQVPLDRKGTMNEVCVFLREMGFKGSNNDVLMQWMFTEGIEDGGLNDRFNQYLKSQGLDGTLTDMKAEWKKI